MPFGHCSTAALGDKMNKEIIISTSQTFLYSFLNADLPEGVNIISEAPIERRGIDWNISVNFDIKLTIDLTKITAFAFATWLFNRIRRPKKEIEININCKQIPIDQTEAIEFIKKEIENKQQEEDKRNEHFFV